MPKDAEYEIELDATEATLCAIEEQLEDDSAVMQAEGAQKVNPTCRLSSCHKLGLPVTNEGVDACSFADCQGTISTMQHQKDLACCPL